MSYLLYCLNGRFCTLFRAFIYRWLSNSFSNNILVRKISGEGFDLVVVEMLNILLSPHMESIVTGTLFSSQITIPILLISF